MDSRNRSHYTKLERHQGSIRYYGLAVVLGVLLGGTVIVLIVAFDLDPGPVLCWMIPAMWVGNAVSRMLLESTPGFGSRMVKRLKTILFPWPSRRD